MDGKGGKDVSVSHAEFEVKGTVRQRCPRSVRRKRIVPGGKIWVAIHRRVVTEPVKLKLEGGRRGVGQEVAGSGSLCKEEEANSD